MIDFPNANPNRPCVSLRTFLAVQASLVPPGDELAWIAKYSAEFRAFVERFAVIASDRQETMSAAALRALAEREFIKCGVAA